MCGPDRPGEAITKALESVSAQCGTVPMLLSPTKRCARILVVDFGPRREDDICEAIESLRSSSEFVILVESLDPGAFPGTNLLQQHSRERILGRAERGAFDVVIGALPVDTWVSLESEKFGGKGRSQIRSSQNPWGLGDLKPHPTRKLKQANVRSLSYVLLASHVRHCGGDWIFLTHRAPADPESAKLEHLEEFASLTAKSHSVDLDLCQLGGEHQGPRTLWSSSPCLVDSPESCTHQHSGKVTLGPSPKLQIPPLLAARIAVGAVECLRRRGGDLRMWDPELVEDEAPFDPGFRIRAPPVHRRWRDASRFSEEYRIQWSRRESSNVVETVTAVSCVKHLGRQKSAWDKKAVLCTDNMCCIGVLGKGRSSAARLLGLARQAAAVTLGTGLRILMRWVPGRYNWADGPSRGHKIGYYNQSTRSVLTT